MATWSSANIAYFQHVYGNKSTTGPQPPVARIAGNQYGPSFDTYYLKSQGKALSQLSQKTLFVPTRFWQLPKVDIDLMKNIFKQSMNFGMYTEYVARMMIRKFAEVAARFSPPNIGKANIDAKYYMRPIYKLEDLAKGLVRTERGKRLYATKEDFAALRRGMKFKVMNTKHGVKRGTVYAYAKGINEAKRLARIQNRGLTKYSWGSVITTFNMQAIKSINKDTAFGAEGQGKSGLGSGKGLTRTALYTTDLPVIFQRLQKKSPNIKKYRWGSVQWRVSQLDGRRLEFLIQNALAEVERYCDIAIRQGINASVREVSKLVKYIETDAADKIEKMFSFKIFRVTQVAALGRIKERTLENYQLGPYNPNKKGTK